MSHQDDVVLYEQIRTIINQNNPTKFNSTLLSIISSPNSSPNSSSQTNNDIDIVYAAISSFFPSWQNKNLYQEKFLPFLCYFLGTCYDNNIDFNEYLDSSLSSIVPFPEAIYPNLLKICFGNNKSKTSITSLYNIIQKYLISHYKSPFYCSAILDIPCLNSNIKQNSKELWEYISTNLGGVTDANEKDVIAWLTNLNKLIWICDKQYAPYATVTLYKSLDYLTENNNSSNIQVMSWTIIYSLTYYCREELECLKENISDFWEVFASGNNSDVNDLCQKILLQFNDKKPVLNVDEIIIETKKYAKYRDKVREDPINDNDETKVARAEGYENSRDKYENNEDCETGKIVGLESQGDELYNIDVVNEEECQKDKNEDQTNGTNWINVDNDLNWNKELTFKKEFTFKKEDLNCVHILNNKTHYPGEITEEADEMGDTPINKSTKSNIEYNDIYNDINKKEKDECIDNRIDKEVKASVIRNEKDSQHKRSNASVKCNKNTVEPREVPIKDNVQLHNKIIIKSTTKCDSPEIPRNEAEIQHEKECSRISKPQQNTDKEAEIVSYLINKIKQLSDHQIFLLDTIESFQQSSSQQISQKEQLINQLETTILWWQSQIAKEVSKSTSIQREHPTPWTISDIKSIPNWTERLRTAWQTENTSWIIQLITSLTWREWNQIRFNVIEDSIVYLLTTKHSSSLVLKQYSKGIVKYLKTVVLGLHAEFTQMIKTHIINYWTTISSSINEYEEYLTDDDILDINLIVSNAAEGRVRLKTTNGLYCLLIFNKLNYYYPVTGEPWKRDCELDKYRCEMHCLKGMEWNDVDRKQKTVISIQIEKERHSTERPLPLLLLLQLQLQPLLQLQKPVANPNGETPHYTVIHIK